MSRREAMRKTLGGDSPEGLLLSRQLGSAGSAQLLAARTGVEARALEPKVR
jgi:hypothetical protein